MPALTDAQRAVMKAARDKTIQDRKSHRETNRMKIGKFSIEPTEECLIVTQEGSNTIRYYTSLWEAVLSILRMQTNARLRPTLEAALAEMNKIRDEIIAAVKERG